MIRVWTVFCANTIQKCQKFSGGVNLIKIQLIHPLRMPVPPPVPQLSVSVCWTDLMALDSTKT